MEIKWSPEQEAAINLAGGRILVSAAAGSGKTAVLSERVKRLILDKNSGVHADRLLIATFSRAAALEMRSRTEAAVDREAEKDPENSFIKRQRMLLGRSNISTIHSFCMNLIRENFESLDIPPNFRIGDENTLKFTEKEAVDLVFAEFYDAGDEGFLNLVEATSSGRGDDGLEKLLLSIYNFLQGQASATDWLDQATGNFDISGKFEENIWVQFTIEQTAKKIRHLIARSEEALALMEDDEAMKKAYGESYTGARELLLNIKEKLEAGVWEDIQKAIAGFKFPKLGRLMKYEDEAKKARVAAIQKEIKDTLEKKLPSREWSFREAEIRADFARLKTEAESLQGLILAFEGEFMRLKREKNILSFSDLEKYALELLAQKNEENIYDKTELAITLQGNYDAIFVDEYQDTNLVQDLIFKMISKNEKNLFLVGDLKQSIYAFRGAEPSLFLKKQDESHEYEGVQKFPLLLRLNKNFRSREGICGGINEIFKEIMSRSIGGSEYNEKEALFASGKFFPSDEAALSFVMLETHEESEESRAEFEARMVARKISAMVAEEFMVNEKGRPRPCRYEDFCILLRSRKEMGVFEKAMLELGLPVWSDFSKKFFESKEVLYLLSLLMAIDNPLLDIELAAAMISPFFRFSAGEIAKIKQDYPESVLYLSVLAAAEGGDEKSVRFVKTLRELRGYSAVSSVDALIQKSLALSEFDLYLWALPNPEIRSENIYFLIEQAKQFEMSGFFGLSSFCRFMRRLIEEDTDIKREATLPIGENLVKIMTIHRSKGLEFPICFLADTRRQFNMMDLRKKQLFHHEYGYGAKIRDLEKMTEYRSLAHESVKNAKEEEALSEEMRVFYVALTRAKDRAFIISTYDDFEKSFKNMDSKRGGGKLSEFLIESARSVSDWVLMIAVGLPAANPIRESLGLEKVLGKPQDIAMEFWGKAGESMEAEARESSALVEKDEAIISKINKRLEFIYPFAKASITETKFSVSDLVLAQQEEEGEVYLKRPRFLSDEKSLTGAEKGNAYHSFMEFADFARAAISPSEEIARLCDLGHLSQGEAKVIKTSKINAILKEPIFISAINADKVYREFSFLVALRKGEEDSPMIQGISDLVAVKDGEVTIIDYKSDYVKDGGELLQKYKRQLNLYVDALEESLGLPIKSSYIYSFQLDEMILVEKDLTGG